VLQDSGDEAEVCALLEQLLARGTSARRQREVAHRDGLTAVVPALLAELGAG
jgi:hypothetical protein